MIAANMPVYLDFHRNLSVDPCNDFYTYTLEFLDKAARTSPVAKKAAGAVRGMRCMPRALSVLIDFPLKQDDAFWLPLRDGVFFFMLCHFMCHVAKPVQDPVTECNVVLKNSPHFSEAFHCVRGSPMNPERCGFFE
ncbi:hypothetical protein MRX96_009334 [Rhipicephalus microplus]